jgi:hypothetical protein
VVNYGRILREWSVEGVSGSLFFMRGIGRCLLENQTYISVFSRRKYDARPCSRFYMLCAHDSGGFIMVSDPSVFDSKRLDSGEVRIQMPVSVLMSPSLKNYS